MNRTPRIPTMCFFSYTTLFIDAFPDLKDTEVNLRDAHFITWFIKNGFDKRLSVA